MQKQPGLRKEITRTKWHYKLNKLGTATNWDKTQEERLAVWPRCGFWVWTSWASMFCGAKTDLQLFHVTRWCRRTGSDLSGVVFCYLYLFIISFKFQFPGQARPGFHLADVRGSEYPSAERAENVSLLRTRWEIRRGDVKHNEPRTYTIMCKNHAFYTRTYPSTIRQNWKVIPLKHDFIYIFIWLLQSRSVYNSITLLQPLSRPVFGLCKHACVCMWTIITQQLHPAFTCPLRPCDSINIDALEMPISLMEALLGTNDWTQVTCFILIPSEEQGLDSLLWNQSMISPWWTAAL